MVFDRENSKLGWSRSDCKLSRSPHSCQFASYSVLLLQWFKLPILELDRILCSVLRLSLINILIGYYWNNLYPNAYLMKCIDYIMCYGLSICMLNTGRDIDTSIPVTTPPHNRPENPLPTNEQQSNPNGHAVAPAVAGKAPNTMDSSAASPSKVVSHFCLFLLLTQFAVIFVG